MKIKKKALIELVILIVVLVVSVPLLKPKIAILLNNKGIDYCNSGEIDKAIPFFKKSLKVRLDPQVYCNLANAYRKKGKLKESIIAYDKALKLDSGCIEAYYGLAYNYEEGKMYKQAISCLKKAESLGSHRAKKELKAIRFRYVVSLFNEAIDLYIEGDKDKAESKLNEVVELEPKFSFAYKMLGDIKFSKDLFDEAIANYEQAIELGLKDFSIYNLYNDIGICYIRLENYSNAIKYLKKAHRLEPTNVDILYNLASALRDNRNFDEALEKYTKLASLKFDYPDVHNNMADIYRSMGKGEEAEEEYKNEIEVVKAKLFRNPDDIYSLNGLALAYNGLREYEKAKKIIDSVIEKSPGYGEAFYTRAKIYENLGEVGKAVKDLEKARNLFPSSGFIDSYLFRLKTKRVIPKDKEFFSNDIIIYLRNGRQIKGRLKRETNDRIFLDVLVGNSFGTIAINREDIESLKKIK